eukprot:gene3556-3824_t
MVAAVADTSASADQLPAALAAAVKGELPPQQVVDKARAVLAELLVDYLGQFQEYIGQTGEMAVASVLAVADATVSGGDKGILGKREIAEKDMIDMLSRSMVVRLLHLVQLAKDTTPCEKDVNPDDPDAAVRQALQKVLQPELDRLVGVPFGVPLLHEIGRVYVRAGDSWRGNLLVQGVKNLADAISHKPQSASATTDTDIGTAAAAALDAATARALWVEEHLADVVNALWRLLSHDLDRVLRGAADGALRAIRDNDTTLGGSGGPDVADEAAHMLQVVGSIFQTALRPFAPGPPAAVVDQAGPAVADAAQQISVQVRQVAPALGQAVEESVNAAAAGVEAVGDEATAQAKLVVAKGGQAAEAGIKSLVSSADEAIGNAPSTLDSAAASAVKIAAPVVEAAANSLAVGAQQLQEGSEDLPGRVTASGQVVKGGTTEAGSDRVGQVAKAAVDAADKAGAAVQQAGKATADNMRAGTAAVAAGVSAAAGDVAREAGAAQELYPQTVVVLAVLISGAGAVVSSGVAEVSRALGAGGADPSAGQGALAAAAQAVAALPEAIKEFDQEQILPQAEAAAGDVMKLAKGVSQQADVVLSRLVGSCRRQDPQLLSELRGELLYMARVLEEPVSSARQAISSADLPGQAQKLEQAVLPTVKEVANTIEEQVAASAPDVAVKLSEAAVLVDQAGEQAAQQVQVGAAVAHQQLAEGAERLAGQVEPAADQAGQVVTAAAARVSEVARDSEAPLVQGVQEAAHELATSVVRDVNEAGVDDSSSPASEVLVKGVPSQAAQALQDVTSDAAAAAGGEQVVQEVVGDAQTAGSDVVSGMKAAASKLAGAAAEVASAAGVKLGGDPSSAHGGIAGAGAGRSLKDSQQLGTNAGGSTLAGGSGRSALAQVDVDAIDTDWPTPVESQALQQVEKEEQERQRATMVPGGGGPLKLNSEREWPTPQQAEAKQ